MSDLKTALQNFKAGREIAVGGKTSKFEPLPTTLPAEFASPDLKPSLAPKGRELVEFRVRTAAQRRGIDPHLAAAVAFQESGFNPKAVSPTGVRGTMQLTKRTGRGLGFDRDNEDENILGGVELLAKGLEKNPDNLEAALAIYPDPKDRPKWIPAVLSHRDKSRTGLKVKSQVSGNTGQVDLKSALQQFRTDKGLPPVEEQVQEDPAAPIETAPPQIAQEPSTSPQNIIDTQTQEAFEKLREVEFNENLGETEKNRVKQELTKVIQRGRADEPLLAAITTGTGTATFGAPAKVKSLGESVLQELGLQEGPDGLPPDADFADRLAANNQDNLDAIQTIVDRNPGSAFAGTISGLAGGPVKALAGGFVKGAGFLRNLGNLLRAGAVEGAAAELGTGGDATDALVTGGVGAVASAGLGGLGTGLRKIGAKALEKSVGKGGVGEDLLNVFGLKQLRSKGTLNQASVKFLEQTQKKMSKLLDRNSKKVVDLPDNTTPGDIQDLADFFLKNEDINTALRLEQIGNSAKARKGLTPAAADFLQGIYGSLARTDAGVRGTVKAKIFEERRRVLRERLSSLFQGSEQKLFEKLKQQRQSVGGTLKALNKAKTSTPKAPVNQLEAIAAFLSGGVTLLPKVVETVPVSSTIGKAGESATNPAIRKVVNALFAQ